MRVRNDDRNLDRYRQYACIGDLPNSSDGLVECCRLKLGQSKRHVVDTVVVEQLSINLSHQQGSDRELTDAWVAVQMYDHVASLPFLLRLIMVAASLEKYAKVEKFGFGVSFMLLAALTPIRARVSKCGTE